MKMVTILRFNSYASSSLRPGLGFPAVKIRAIKNLPIATSFKQLCWICDLVNQNQIFISSCSPWRISLWGAIVSLFVLTTHAAFNELMNCFLIMALSAPYKLCPSFCNRLCQMSQLEMFPQHHFVTEWQLTTWFQPSYNFNQQNKFAAHFINNVLPSTWLAVASDYPVEYTDVQRFLQPISLHV